MDPTAALAESQKRLEQLRRPKRWFGLGGSNGAPKLDHGLWAKEFGAIHDQLFLRGRASWACIMMANNGLFIPGRRDLPAAVVYSFDRVYDANPAALRNVADAVAQLRNGTRDTSLAEFAAVVMNEASVEKNCIVPPKLTFGLEVRYETLYIQRHRLPGAYLAHWLLPVIIDESMPSQVMLLPLELWPRELLKEWESAAQANPAQEAPPPLPVNAQTYRQNPVMLTPGAAAEMRRVIAEQGLEFAKLRVGWDEGAALDITEEPLEPGRDFATESQGLCIVVDRNVAARVVGMTVDFQRTAQGAGFVFKPRTG
jgi:Fe-S cluster assembly iron-binding protein IscA